MLTRIAGAGDDVIRVVRLGPPASRSHAAAGQGCGPIRRSLGGPATCCHWHWHRDLGSAAGGRVTVALTVGPGPRAGPARAGVTVRPERPGRVRVTGSGWPPARCQPYSRAVTVTVTQAGHRDPMMIGPARRRRPGRGSVDSVLEWPVPVPGPPGRVRLYDPSHPTRTRPGSSAVGSVR
jgi:hypothetical protein